MMNFTDIYKNLKELNDAADYEKKSSYEDWKEKRKQLEGYEKSVSDYFLPMFLGDPDLAIEAAQSIPLKKIPLDKQVIPIYIKGEGKVDKEVLIIGQYSVNHYYDDFYKWHSYDIGYAPSGLGLPYTPCPFDERDAIRIAYANHLYIDLDFLEMTEGNQINLPAPIKSRLYAWQTLLKSQKWNRRGKAKYSLVKEQ